jgi:predicted dienelactone hydrolase
VNHHFPSIALLFILQWTTTIAFGRELITLQRQDVKPVPAMVYKSESNECRGVAIISHGAGGSEQGYAYLGEAMSSLGYLSLVVGHKESGLQALQAQIRGGNISEGLASLITESNAYQARFLDITAARHWAVGQCGSNFTILMGHSMGAATVMMAAGARNHLNIPSTPDYNAYIALSPQGSGSIFPVNAWSDITPPVLMLTGTQDKELGGVSWESRTEPFQNMTVGCKWLGVIDGATHMNFAGRGFSKNTETLTKQLIRDFLNAIEVGDCRSNRQRVGMTLKTKSLIAKELP